MNKAKEILYKHAENNGCKSVLSRNPYLEQAVLNAINEALTIPVDVGQSEQLKAFLRWAENEWMETPPERQWEQMFDEYFKSL